MPFIDSLMTHLGQPYYVALLSAVAPHGASHQAPQVFQVMVRDNTFVRNKTVGGTRLRFYSTSNIGDDPVQRLAVPTGHVTVSTKDDRRRSRHEAPLLGRSRQRGHDPV